MLQKKHFNFLLFFILFSNCIEAQVGEVYEHTWEMGLSGGVAHYFGDINPEVQLKNPKPAIGLFITKQINDYVGFKVTGNYLHLGYADSYSTNIVQKRRNLSFETDVWELTCSGTFNFFMFDPNYSEDYFTPYMGLGIGIFKFDPYTYLNGTKYNLRLLGTEGQLNPRNPNSKTYSSVAMCYPLTFGFKYNINTKYNLFAEFCYRFTSTDYLDDVSGTYDPNAFNPAAGGQQKVAYLLQDRSYETGERIGISGRQRGNTSQKDSYASFQVGISLNIQSFRCPKY